VYILYDFNCIDNCNYYEYVQHKQAIHQCYEAGFSGSIYVMYLMYSFAFSIKKITRHPRHTAVAVVV